jgi:hypothetical protein
VRLACLVVTAERPVNALVRVLLLSDIGKLADFVLMHAVTGTAEALAAAAGQQSQWCGKGQAR